MPANAQSYCIDAHGRAVYADIAGSTNPSAQLVETSVLFHSTWIDLLIAQLQHADPAGHGVAQIGSRAVRYAIIPGAPLAIIIRPLRPEPWTLGGGKAGMISETTTAIEYLRTVLLAGIHIIVVGPQFTGRTTVLGALLMAAVTAGKRVAVLSRYPAEPEIPGVIAHAGDAVTAHGISYGTLFDRTRAAAPDLVAVDDVDFDIGGPGQPLLIHLLDAIQAGQQVVWTIQAPTPQHAMQRMLHICGRHAPEDRTNAQAVFQTTPMVFVTVDRLVQGTPPSRNRRVTGIYEAVPFSQVRPESQIPITQLYQWNHQTQQLAQTTSASDEKIRVIVQQRGLAFPADSWKHR